jgi:hypothetical protein
MGYELTNETWKAGGDKKQYYSFAREKENKQKSI